MKKKQSITQTIQINETQEEPRPDVLNTEMQSNINKRLATLFLTSNTTDIQDTKSTNNKADYKNYKKLKPEIRNIPAKSKNDITLSEEDIRISTQVEAYLTDKHPHSH